MKIDNGRIVAREKKLFYVLIISLIIILSILFFTNIMISPVFGVSREILAIALCAVYIGITLFRYVRDYNYLYFNDEKGKLIFRYYSVRQWIPKYKTIELEKPSIIKFEIKKSIFGLKKGLVLYQKLPAGAAKYPPISITALNDEEIMNLQKALQIYISR